MIGNGIINENILQFPESTKNFINIEPGVSNRIQMRPK
jgi:hypothetical protein